jgi:ribosomal protein S24E|tara:strand:+ start:627 stop:1070 length:444 start_codon:yes stop_codon:yes gene_type:complete
MDITITEKKENPTLSRTEIDLKLSFIGDTTPSKEDLKKEIAKSEKASEDTIIINSIYNAFGEGSAAAHATIYKSKADLDRVEPQPKKEAPKEGEAAKEAPKADAKAEEKPADTPKEAPAEEAKEESKKEAPKEEKKEEPTKEEEKKE